VRTILISCFLSAQAFPLLRWWSKVEAAALGSGLSMIICTLGTPSLWSRIPLERGRTYIIRVDNLHDHSLIYVRGSTGRMIIDSVVLLTVTSPLLHQHTYPITNTNTKPVHHTANP
jgi:ribosomal protein RSM22 (predicted rRNA methylase)